MIDKNYVENLTQVVVSKSELLRLMEHYEIVKAQVETLKLTTAYLTKELAQAKWDVKVRRDDALQPPSVKPVTQEIPYILDKVGMP